MTRPAPAPRPQFPVTPLPPQPKPERLDTPGARTVPIMIGGAANYGE